MRTIKSTQRKIGNTVRTVVKTADTNNHANTRMTQVAYQNNKQPIPVSKTIYKANLKDGSIKVREVAKGPANYYGKQTRTVTKRKIK